MRAQNNIQDRKTSQRVNLVELLQDGPPRFSSPVHPDMPIQNKIDLPLMLYIPGLDGTGFAASQQFLNLSRYFDLRILIVPPTDRSTFEELVAIVKEYLALEANSGPAHRPIYVFGESFGGLLTLAVGASCREIVHRLILVNPASSYERSFWPVIAPLVSNLPGEIYRQLPYLFSPMLISPTALINSKNMQQLLQNIVKTFDSIRRLESLNMILPVETLSWKFGCLQDGCDFMNKIGYSSIEQPTLILTGDIDLLIPSGAEGPRLEQLLPNAKNIRFADRGHQIVQDKNFNLAWLIQESNFYITKCYANKESVLVTSQ
eukprot:TRINITY_DN40382_c0_g1_i4.p2 TRINITY_DN40382_c0_g1~~TRINITY_DN40382_c0_g1_i4.p2  ORF type:complete len:318 (+),score=17.59 TRINITY_DN40382_c0_g1_i4:121-1074(+)